jgi:5-methylcytosine-specific restriction endonuclease McrBC regulatory subunit McrC
VQDASYVIHRGLTRAYIESEDSLPSLRGRLVVAREARRVIHDRIDCRYSELSPNTLENLLLKSSLHQLHDRYPTEISTLLSRMREVSLTDITRGPWPRIRYSQLNRHYKRTLDLARLAIRGPPQHILLERRILFRSNASGADPRSLPSNKERGSPSQFPPFDPGLRRPDLRTVQQGS